MDSLGYNTLNLAGEIGTAICPTQIRTRFWPHGRVTLTLSAIFLLSLCPALARASNISVCPSGCDQTTIAAAIAAANSGDTITIGAGTYPFNVEIGKNLTLQGSGSASTILDGGNVGTAMIVDPGTTVTLQGATVENGGDNLSPTWGIRMFGNLTIADSVITNNQVGIRNEGGVLTVLRSTISNNRGDDLGFGAGLENINGSAALFNTTVSGNYAEEFGGIGIKSGTVTVQNSTVSGNTSLSFTNIGSGFPGGLLSLQNSTVVNSAGNGLPSMGFSDTSQIAMSNTIVSSTTGSANCLNFGAVLSLGHNLSSDDSCGLTDPTDRNNNASINLGPLQTNAPGATATHALLAGSSAIDAGDCSLQAVSFDQRGASRPQGPACDIGAYELRAPIANNDAYVAMQGRTMVLPAPCILSNDLSPDGLPLSIFSVSSDANATLIVTLNGGVQYFPKIGFLGQDTVTYTVWDGVHVSNSATVSFNVTSSNTPPVAQNDSYSVVEGQVLTVTPAQGLLANDTDSDGDPISLAFYNRPSHGTLWANADGSFLYTPAAGFYGTDSFTYEATDGQATSGLATASIAVTPNFGTITIVLNNLPQTTVPFSFTGSLGNFTLGAANPTSKTFQVAAGTWNVTESRPRPWLMANIVCSAAAGNIVDLTLNNLQVTLADGGNITCTFINELPAAITVHAFRDINGDGTKQSAEPFLRGITMQLFTFPIPPIASAPTDSGGKAAFGNLPSRVYTVCAILPAGWTSTNPPVVDPAYGKPCFTVNVNPGQNVPLLFGMRK